MQLNKILKNILSLTVGNILNLLLNFFSIVLTARYLDVNLFGDFSYLVAIIGILSKFIDLGLNPIIFRDTSKNPSDHSYINSAIILKLVSFIVFIIIFNAAAFIFRFSTVEILLSNILCTGIIFSAKFQNFRDVLEVPFKVDLKMHFPMLFNLIDNLLLLTLVLLMPVLNGGIFYFVFAYTFSNLPGFLFLLIMLNKKYGYRFRLELSQAKEIITQALPLYGYSLLMVVYQQADIILLKYFKDSYATGIFSGAVRLSFPLYIFPTALIATIFPSISRNIGLNEKQNTSVMSLGIKVVILFSFFVALFVTFKSEEIVTLILGANYKLSHTPLIFLLWSQVFIFVSFMINDYLTAYKMQKWNFLYAALMVVINLSITILLIKDLSYIAPSISKIISGFAGLSFIIYITRKIKLNFTINFIRIAGWGIISAAVLYLVSYLSLPLYIILSPVLFIAVVFGLRYFSGEEIKKLLSLFKINIGSKWLSSL